mmetsp:Transcript_43465/g.125633  ORF Transcript_43465/g.125633 Transcript_43465/m.125633 type:complete len:836 (+) Transcript_43465:95-2602(+)
MSRASISPGMLVMNPALGISSGIGEKRKSVRNLGGPSEFKSRFSLALDRDLTADDGEEHDPAEAGHAALGGELESSTDTGAALSAQQDEPNIMKFMDEMEVSLGEAFREHRCRVEEILEKHCDNMESVHAAHDLERSKLRAENAMLRDKLRLKPEEVQLPQAVMLNRAQQHAKHGSSPNGARKKLQQGGDRGKRDEDEGAALSKSGSKGRKGDKTPSGSWTQFVAWVPSGSALQAPQPWKELTPEMMAAGIVDGTSKKKRTPKGARNDMLSILPGRVNDRDDDSSDKEDGGPEKPKYTVVPVFEATAEELEAARKHRAKRTAKNQKLDKNSTGPAPSVGRDEMEEEAALFCDAIAERPWYMIHPHSRGRISWDFCSLFLVVYDMIMVPMGVFALTSNLFLLFMEWTTRLFWTIDMIVSQLTAVVMPDGSVNFNWRFIAKRYLRTWFAIDLFIVITDWVELLTAQADSLALGKATRAFRIVRVVRLLRLVRMREVMEQIQERIQSDKLAFLTNIVNIFLFIVSVAHIMACLWWGIGDRDNPLGNSWISHAMIFDASVDVQYLTALHWSVSQFTGGMDEITPGSSMERFFAICIWIFAFVASAFMVSFLTSKLTQLHIIDGARSRQLLMLRQYLKQNAISGNLALRMQRSAQHALSADLTADVIELLPVVSEPLRIEMHFEMYFPSLRLHHFFAEAGSDSPQVIRRICHFAMSTLLLASGDMVFSKGELPREPKMYIVSRGQLEYTGAGECVPVTEKIVISEAALWTTWRHQGALTALSDVKLFMLDAHTFQEIGERFKELGTFDCRLYAQEFIAALNKADPPTDLTVTGSNAPKLP